MSNTGTKGLPAGTNAFPQPDGIGKPPGTPKATGKPKRRAPIPVSAELRGAAIEVAKAVRDKCRRELDAEPKTADRAARLFRLGLTVRRRPGRPTSKDIDRAYQIWQRDKEAGRKIYWRTIAEAVVTDWATLTNEQRLLQRERLRKDVKARLRRQSRRYAQAPVHKSTPEIVPAT